ncbi:hypothetical protein NYE48_20795 [Paenibacillus sp. FSL M7-1455]|uniref:hypothetical protein n=1 Tax=Paenibacillus sp. FSL M7-1455 TaxID=2975316 RepID=UPI0030FCDF31
MFSKKETYTCSSIIGKEAGADLSVVICYRLLRTLFIFLAVPPLLKAIFRSMLRKRSPA